VLSMRDIEPMMKALAGVVKEHVGNAFTSLKKQIDELKNSLQEIPAPEEIAELAKKLIPDPLPGKDADPEVMRQMIQEEVAKLPPAENGKSVSLDDVKPLLDELVADRVKEIPPAPAGESVPIEEVQRMVDEAVAKAVAAIQLPKDGEPGRDAADIEILPAIDLSKSYPRGTYANHAGGLWRSYQATDGMKGWDCIVDGTASIEFLQVDERNYSLSVEKSSGQKVEKSIYFPVQIYRGAFRAGHKYSPGDTVSWAGAQWHCNEETSDRPGELASKGWTLCVKRGHNGKDLRDAKDVRDNSKGVSIR
jgi:hypothetical protein